MQVKPGMLGRVVLPRAQRDALGLKKGLPRSLPCAIVGIDSKVTAGVVVEIPRSNSPDEQRVSVTTVMASSVRQSNQPAFGWV